MKDDIIVHEYGREKYPDAMAVVGFPSIGLVSSIAANFIIRTLSLSRVAGAISQDFPPYTLVHDGVPSPPVRFYAGKRKCDKRNGEQCQQIVAIAAEFMPKPDLVKPLADSIVKWCKEKEIRTILTLEGINWLDKGEEATIFGVGSTPKARDILERYDIQEMKEGMVSGMSGVLLFEGERMRIDVICLLGPAKTDFPDARGSARLLEVVARMLPELKLDPDPLYKEAEEIEKQIKAAMLSVNQPKKMSPEESLIYG